MLFFSCNIYGSFLLYTLGRVASHDYELLKAVDEGVKMNCENCGAPMTVFSTGDYFFCEYCGSYHFPKETRDRVKVLDQVAENLRCPICEIPLVRAAIDRRQGYVCRRCQGFLINQTSFRKIVKHRRARAIGPPLPPKLLDREALKRRVSCPRCGEVMDTHPYYGPGNLVVDNCTNCSMIWLDRSELSTIVDAPGRDRGFPEEDMIWYLVGDDEFEN